MTSPSRQDFTRRPRPHQQAKTEAEISDKTEAELSAKTKAELSSKTKTESDCTSVIVSPRIQGVSSRCASFQSAD